MAFLYRFFFGAILGSFLDVVALRYDPDRFLFGRHVTLGRSACSHCRRILHWYELIPVVSFLIQRGRCRSCGGRIARENLFVEIAAGLVTAFVPVAVAARHAVAYGSGAGFFFLSAAWVAAFLVLLLVALIDLRLRIIPDEAHVLLVALGALLLGYEHFFSGVRLESSIGPYALLFGLYDSAWLARLLGAASGLAFFGGLFAARRGRWMGMGDVKLMGALGFLFGWPDIIFVAAFGFVIGSLYAVMVMLRRTATMKSTLPFGPFLALGAVTLFFFGEAFVRWYFSLFP